MAKGRHYTPSKVPLTESEKESVREWMDNSPQDKKPSIRTIAKALRRTRPTVIKSLGGWEGIHRNRPEPKKLLIPKAELGLDIKPEIEPFTTRTEIDEKI